VRTGNSTRPIAGALVDVRYGSLADISAAIELVCFLPKADISFIADTFCARRAQGNAADRLAKKISSGDANGVRISNLIGLLPPSVSGNWPRVGSERLGGRHVVLG